jgi:hypothetical protein
MFATIALQRTGDEVRLRSDLSFERKLIGGSMTRDVAELEREILELDPKDQARLASVLLEALGPPPGPEDEEDLLEDIERRSAAIDAGLMDLVPAQVVIACIRSELASED